MEKRIAVLSNINMNFVIRELAGQAAVYETEGYGNELGTLMNPASSYYSFAPQITFLVMDLMELLEHKLEPEAAQHKVEAWFALLDGVLDSRVIYYISDAYLWGTELAVVWDSGRKQQLEALWQQSLEACCKQHSNVRILPYRRLVERLGEEHSFSLKMWYMGKLLLTGEAQKRLAEVIQEKAVLEDRICKKVLVLDLDNTLWGGLAGENDHTPIALSEDHKGLAYKNLQRVILQMQKQGVLLAISSKNNESDVLPVLAEHPHMILREDAFVAKRINWNPKPESLREMAAELNLGLDSFVFWDDSPAERRMVQEMAPEVMVPDFPEKAEELAPAMVQIYRDYFEQPSLTGEDQNKTSQYVANAARKKVEQQAVSFEDYLSRLQIRITRVPAVAHMERLQQLLNKTNQFNLTTRRFSAEQLAEYVESPQNRVFFYQVADCFGDNGLVAAVLVHLDGREAEITDFVMSCRVMGKNIEYAVLEHVEQTLRSEGCRRLRGRYLPTAKNHPVAQLYTQAGYQSMGELPEGGQEYELLLEEHPERNYYVEFQDHSQVEQK